MAQYMKFAEIYSYDFGLKIKKKICAKFWGYEVHDTNILLKKY
jgi:hypothetical protein